MNNEQMELKKFLAEQVNWCKQQDAILEKIENKLYEMKELAEYARDHCLSLREIDEVNCQLAVLKQEVHSLEQQLQSVVH